LILSAYGRADAYLNANIYYDEASGTVVAGCETDVYDDYYYPIVKCIIWNSEGDPVASGTASEEYGPSASVSVGADADLDEVYTVEGDAAERANYLNAQTYAYFDPEDFIYWNLLGSISTDCCFDFYPGPNGPQQGPSVIDDGSVQQQASTPTPAGLSVLDVGVLDCPSASNYGISMDIHYQVMDNSSPPKALKSSKMRPQEYITWDDGTHMTDYGNVVPSPYHTQSDGTFHDVPVADCHLSPFTNKHVTQLMRIYLPASGNVYPVRTNNWVFDSSGLGHGHGTNNNDVEKSR